ncbi:amidase family protein, partial [Brevibacterium paucivorans]
LADVEALRERALAQFADVDVIVSPALDGGTVPWDSIGPDARPAFVRYSQLFNVLGWPAITIPTGRKYESGAPACLHIAGKPGEDATVLAVAAEVER